jgi:hypothetical protein
LPSITAGTLVNTQLGFADYNVTVGAAGCSAGAAVVITETVAVTAAGQLCQRVWVNTASPGITSCATVMHTKMLIVSGGVPPGGGFGLLVFAGGSTADLVTASGCPVATAAFWVSDGAGGFVVYVPGTAIAVVNADWNAKFAMGIPANTPLIGRCQ